MVFKFKLMALAALVAGLSACGGGGSSDPAMPSSGPMNSVSPAVSAAPPAPTTAPVSTYTAGSAEKVMFDKLNHIRMGGGFGALTQSDKIDTAAKAHAGYVTANYFVNGLQIPGMGDLTPSGWLRGHTETVGTPGFTGALPFNRIAATGYSSVTTNEIIGFPYSTFNKAKADTSVCLDRLMNSVFHRAALLDTTFQEVGFGLGPEALGSDGYYGFTPCVIDFGSQYAPRALSQGWTGIYPFDGQSSVPLLLTLEAPDPVPSVSIKGMPISLQTSSGQNLTVGSLVVKDGAGVAVIGTVLTMAQSPYLRSNEVYFVPTGSLKAKTTYSVAFAGTSNGVAVNKNWSFTTAPQ